MQAQEILNYIDSALALAVLGYLWHLIRVIRLEFNEREKTIEKNANSIKEILNARLENVKEQKIWNEERFSKEKEDLLSERDKLKNELDLALNEGNISYSTFSLEESAKNLGSELSHKIEKLTKALEQSEGIVENENPEYHISMANGFMSNKDWHKAVYHYEKAVKSSKSDWKLYLSAGVANANTRNQNLAALRSYSDAIAFLPNETDSNIKSRLFTYRGAMLKRLRRVDEAIQDVELGKTLATKRYEIDDSLYNLGCLYAMKNNEIKFIEIADELRSRNELKFEYMKERLSEFAPEFRQTKAFRNL